MNNFHILKSFKMLIKVLDLLIFNWFIIYIYVQIRNNS